MVRVTAGRLRLRTFGVPSLTDEAGQTPQGMGWGKPLALLCFLSIRHEAPREEVVDLLWRDTDPAKARNTFRQALHRLRGALGEDLLPPDREWVRLVPSAELWIDNAQFEAAAIAGRLDEALELYSGEYLERSELGEPAFDSWADQERARFRARARQLLHDGVARAADAGNWPDAIARSNRLLGVAPFDAQAAELAATTLVSAGRGIEARELLQQFGQRLDAELGIPLPPELQALGARLQRQIAERPAAAGSTGSPDLLAFAGREAELSQLLALWRGTGEDSGAFALIEGDPGTGKSRLTRELASHARTLGRALVLTGRERPAGAQLPLGVFAEALRPLVRAPGIAGASRHLLAEAARLLPDLRDSFDLPAVSDVEDEAARLRFFEGIAALIDAAAYEQRIMLVVEDAHSIAPSSLDLLFYLSARLAGSAVMFVVTARASQAGAALLARLRALALPTDNSAPPHGDRARRLTLAPLSLEASLSAVRPALTAAGVAERIADRVARRAEGIPASLAELARRAMSGDELGELPVPMRDLIADRLQRLSSAQRRLLLVIAMIGRPVHRDSAAAAAHVSSIAAAELVGTLEREGLVEVLSDGIVATDLASDVVLASAEQATRAFLGGWIAEAFTREPHAAPAELARFHALAGNPREAFDSARKAAFHALAFGALPEGLQFLRTARAFAQAPGEREEIESYLTAIGAGQRRIATPASSTAAANGAAAVPASSEPTHVEAAPPGPIPTRWERALPHWRFLLGAAVATLVISAVTLAPRSDLTRAATTSATDTLVVADGDGGRTLRLVTGDLRAGFTLSARAAPAPSRPVWLDSLSRPWGNGVAAPNAQYVAASRVTAEGTRLYVITADRRDTLPILPTFADAVGAGWSPDSRWLLAIGSHALPSGGYTTGLYAHHIAGNIVAPIDTAQRHTVTEAAWSPDGSRIAWVALAGSDRQSEVFVSFSDGSGMENVSRHPSDDQHIAWSGDGELLAFTSMRDGNAELYAYGVRDNRLWRLTRDPAQDDRAAFAPNGRLIGFESTRGGVAGVYVMPRLGGDAVRIGGANLSLVHWRGGQARYLDRVRVHVQGGGVSGIGDSAMLTLVALDQLDDSIGAHAVRWVAMDTSLSILAPAVDSTATRRTLIARRSGLAQIVANVGRWRSDTAFVRIGSEPVPLTSFNGRDVTPRWHALGEPRPWAGSVSGRSALSLGADRESDSGVLSRSAFPLLPSLELSASLALPGESGGDAATSVNVALVAPETEETIDAIAPQFLRHASFTWTADPRRFVYSVGREVHTEPAPGVGASVDVRLFIEADSTVTFFVDGQRRWRSTLRIITPSHAAKVQAWIGGRATGDRAWVFGARAMLVGPSGSDAP
ncbi:MAG: AAA family ATPase [Gemmatimonadaceae bacterium]